MSQHHQDQFVPSDGADAGDRVKKPRHKKFQTQSYGERMAAEAVPSTGGENRGEVRNDVARGERRGGPSQYSDRGSRDSRDAGGYRRDGNRDNRAEGNRGTSGNYRGDSSNYRGGNSTYRAADSGGFRRDNDRRDDRRPERSTDRPVKGYRAAERPAAQSRPERTERPQYERSDRPQYQRTERPQNERSDRPQYQRSDAPRREFDRSDRPQSGQRSGGYQRSERQQYDRPQYDRGERTRYERPERVELTERPERPVEEFVDLGPVAEGNPFSALGLAPRLVQRLARDGITAPFPIQTATIPDALAGKDVLGRGQTGSGKTLGFGLPTLMRLAGGHTESRRPRGMILVPTRELAMQVHDALEPLAHVMGVSVKLIAGGLPYPKQIDALRRGVDLLIATPGRLIDLCEQGAADLGAVEVAVLDEADHMCDMGFMPAVTTLLDMTPKEGQRLLFSATLDNDVDTIVKTYLKDPVTHSTESGQASVTTMEHHLLVIEPGHKQSLTAELASRDGRTIIFVRTKLGADRVATQLRDRGVMAAALHGGLTQGARNRTLDQFKDGSVPVLVATDVAARGIHVDDVGLVVQADPPAEHKDYLHRAGRTARAGGKGAVVTLLLPHQRRGMIRMAESAGVDTEPVRARPGDELVTELTGGTKPSGYPVKLPEPKPKRFGGKGGGGKRFGSGRPGGRSFEGRGGDARRRPDRGSGPRRSEGGKSYQPR
ncbi:DEAD/DEAH box helicase domain protein [Kribbella flavida DSM 17836]|uniref:DEAD/DEAH box helicase domain protein n=1 Tax=Kribbella flavida (strain DSM 17836 / JCM 10339 / NBRC 14399) TaxID=479435 RepID=D2Q1I3_KRIFD|nr:DEAD/DEAH box helicase [Kribbella flavida]ADB30171.1 DEAD/DEAH box helicase domain protein [Kribbella flavida DSM 17836]